MGIRDTRMMAKAMTQRWDIKPEYRDAIVKRLARIVIDPSSSPREVTAASKALMSAEAQNQADEHKVVDVRVSTRHDRLDAIATDLGIDPSLIESFCRQTNVSPSVVASDGGK